MGLSKVIIGGGMKFGECKLEEVYIQKLCNDDACSLHYSQTLRVHFKLDCILEIYPSTESHTALLVEIVPNGDCKKEQ